MGGGVETGTLFSRAVMTGLIAKAGFERRLEGGEGLAKGNPPRAEETWNTASKAGERLEHSRSSKGASAREPGGGYQAGTATGVGKHWPAGQFQPLCLFLYTSSWRAAILVHLHIV